MTSEERTFDDALAAWKRAAVPSSNADLSERVTQAAVGDYRFRRRVKWTARAVGGSLCLFALGFAIWYHDKANDGIAKLNQSTIINPLSKSDEIFKTMAKAITTETPGITSLPAIPAVPTVQEQEKYITSISLPDADRFIAIPQAARASFEPVTQPASRAVNRMVKDLGSAFSLPKPKM